jgi:hypothetical protein
MARRHAIAQAYRKLIRASNNFISGPLDAPSMRPPLNGPINSPNVFLTQLINGEVDGGWGRSGRTGLPGRRG